jgi:hypothetical protein
MYPLVHTCDGTQPKRCECYRAWMREYQRRRRAGSGRSSEENRRFNLWRLYGVTPEEVEALREAQDYRCAICGRHEDELERPATGRPRVDGSRSAGAALVVDHCHETGQIRGLLSATPATPGWGTSRTMRSGCALRLPGWIGDMASPDKTRYVR